MSKFHKDLQESQQKDTFISELLGKDWIAVDEGVKGDLFNPVKKVYAEIKHDSYDTGNLCVERVKNDNTMELGGPWQEGCKADYYIFHMEALKKVYIFKTKELQMLAERLWSNKKRFNGKVWMRDVPKYLTGGNYKTLCWIFPEDKLLDFTIKIINY